MLSIYLHPSRLRQLAPTLFKHLRSPLSRKHAIRVVGGDFNRLQSKFPTPFTDILTELDCPSPPLLPTYRQQNGYRSALDFFLLQTPLSFNQCVGPPKIFAYWPKYQPTGHAIYTSKFPKPTVLSISSDDTAAPTIPTSAFFLPPSLRVANSAASPPLLQPLIRALLSLPSPSLLDAKATNLELVAPL